MERPQRKRLRLESYDYSQPGSYFITICTRERNQEVLCSIEPAVGAIINRPIQYQKRPMVKAECYTTRRLNYNYFVLTVLVFDQEE